ncbi:TadE/TadG family type IV pilus assembly protein [Roseovarius aestuarii]|uniref:TadE-like protein n=1 Tax=Roseovarius aestuarii TaxID=475083 RepID=A0A1X7BXT4_9RHOB|nr:TadE/TadG family type IV pilus assembly protein [Roseovarius aestuarii]SMC14467.1 TadE-like protein [Roseovarius aestuarii]
MKNPFSRKFIQGFLWDTSGVALVEFAIMLPMMLLLFAVIIEGGRLMWSYQSVNAGVRDAARYLARVAPGDICTAGGSVASYKPNVETIVRNTISGNSFLPSQISVNSVTPSLNCVAGVYRVSPAPIVTVTATMTIQFPFAGIFTLNGQNLGTVNTAISDQNKVYGS